MFNMKQSSITIFVITITLILSACHSQPPAKTIDLPNEQVRSNMPMIMGHGLEEPDLNDSTGENELNIPQILSYDQLNENNIYYTINAQIGKTEIFDNVQTTTLGYNSSFLGPIIKLKKDQTAHFKLINSLDEETTFHWHGLIIDGAADGGPHEVIQSGEQKDITFKVQQDPATLWFHPHPIGKTAKQVYEGLAGLIYIENDEDTGYEHGVNDFPLIFQDRTFDANKQLNYEFAQHLDGQLGETLLIDRKSTRLNSSHVAISYA